MDKVNPAALQFTISPDHGVMVGATPVVDGYRARFTSAGSDDLVVDLGKPQPAADSTITASLPTLPHRQSFTLQIETYGGGGLSLSPASDPFVTLDAPAAVPTAPTVS